MKPLSSIQQKMAYFVHSAKFDWRDRLIQKMLFLFIACAAVCFTATWAYLIEQISIDMEKSLYAVFEIAAGSITVNAVFTNFFSYHKLATIFQGLEIIYDTSTIWFFIQAKSELSLLSLSSDWWISFLILFSWKSRFVSICAASKRKMWTDFGVVLEIHISWLSNQHFRLVHNFRSIVLDIQGHFRYKCAMLSI